MIKRIDRAEFLKKTLVYFDGGDVTNDVSLYIYTEAEEDLEHHWYVINNKGQYYDVYEDLTQALDYIATGSTDTRLYSFEPAEFKKVDDTI